MIPDLLGRLRCRPPGGRTACHLCYDTTGASTAIRQNRAFLSRHPTSLFQVIHNALSWRADESQTKFLRATTASQEPQGVQLPELQSLLGRWIRQKAEVAGPFPIAGSLRPPETLLARHRTSLSAVSIRPSARFTSPKAPVFFIAVTSRDKGDAVRDRKAVSSAFGLFDPESGVELFPPLEIGSDRDRVWTFPRCPNVGPRGRRRSGVRYRHDESRSYPCLRFRSRHQSAQTNSDSPQRDWRL